MDPDRTDRRALPPEVELEALRESEERWQFALEGAGDGVWDWNPTNDVVYFSPRWKEMLGYGETDLPNAFETWRERVHPDDLASALDDLQRHLRGKTEVFVNEHRLRCKDGSYKWILDRGKVVRRAPDGRPLRVIGTHADLTAQRRAEADLRQKSVDCQLLASVSLELSSMSRPRDVFALLTRTAPSLLPGCITIINRTTDDGSCLEVLDIVGLRETILVRALGALGFDPRGRTFAIEDRFRALCGHTHLQTLPGGMVDLGAGTVPVTAARVLERLLSIRAVHTIALGEGTRLLGSLHVLQRREGPLDSTLVESVVHQCSLALLRIESLARLSESEQRFRQLAESIGETFWLRDAATGRILYVSPAFESTWGRSAASLYTDSQAFARAIHPEDAGRVAVSQARLQRERVPFDERYRIVRPDGEIRWIHARAFPVYDERGACYRFAGIATDISAQRRTEDALARRENLLRRVFEVLPVGLWIADRDGRLLSGNPAGIRIWGAEPHVGPENYGVFRAWRLPSREELNPEDWALGRTVREGVTILDELLEIEAFDGQRKTILNSTAPVLDDDGRVEGAIIVNQDVTSQRRAEAALRESEDRYRTLLEASPFSILVLQDGRYVYANPAGLRLLASPDLATLLETPVLDTIHPDSHALIRQRMERAARGASNAPFEVRLLRFDGTSVVAESTSVPVVYGGRPAALILGQDVTARRDAERERMEMERRLLHAQKLESLGVLAGGIAHDFNNLLAAVLGNLDLVDAELPATSPARAHVEDAARASRRAVDLTRQMLAYSGKGRFVVRPVDLSLLVRDNARLLRTSVARTIAIELELADRVPPILADPGEMQQIVMNLLTNASEAIGDRPGTITLRTGVMHGEAARLTASRVEPPPPPGEFVFVEVEDSGCGMDAETQHRLFDPFFTTKFTGRGLGMSAVHGIVRGHGGALLVDSALEQGTRIRVLFPTLSAPEAAGSKPPVAPDRAAPATPPDEPRLCGTVLLADDEEPVRRMGRRMLERLGFDVVAAENGAEAVARFRERPGDFAAVILDLTMPTMDGVSALHAVKAIRRDVPIVLSSGYGEESVATRFRPEDLAGFIQKPYRLEGLRRTMQRALGLAGRGGPSSA